MCGIVGFTGPGADAQALLRRMMAPIRHRGPDEDGTFVDPRIAVGHLRLTIVAPEGGHQPRVDPETGDLLVFNGEIYDYRSHASRLRDRGVRLRDGSDTEVLFQTIRLVGIEAALDRLDGMFAFAFRDGASGTLYLARDRFGEKPLAFARRGGELVFASEVRSLLHHPALEDAGFDREAIAAYLALDYVPAPRTGLEGVEKLRPGELVAWREGRLDRSFYWLPRPPSAGGPEAAPRDLAGQADHLLALLDRSIEERLVADVPVGLFLSGGLDSALIAARASRLAPGISAHTIRFEGDGYDETPHAAEVARSFGLRQEVRDVDRASLLAALETVESKMDEPFADSSIIPTYLLCQTARREVTVALSGDGGDELFAGYLNFQALSAAPFLAAMPEALGGLPRAMVRALGASDGYMSLGFKLDQLMQGWAQPARYQPFQWMAAFPAPEIRAFMGTAEKADCLKAAVDAELDLAHPTDAVERLQYLFCRLYLANDILTKVDRASMYNSLEVRAPFLAREVAEFALSLPVPMKLRRGRTKRILRHLAAQWLPPSITRRAKHGFALPVAGLLRGPLAEPVADTLADRDNPLAEMVSRPLVERLLSEHRSRRRDHRKRIWSLYCLFVFARNIRAIQSEASRRRCAPAP